MIWYVRFEIVSVIVLGVIAVVGLLYKVDRYKTKHTKEEGFRKTGEKFVEKGKTIEVYYNPKTGERSYREVKGS